MPSAVASNRNRVRCRTRMGGSASKCTCWLASIEVDWPTRKGCFCDVCTSESKMVCTESDCSRSLGLVTTEGVRNEGKRTWMSSWSDRQSSPVKESGWFGALIVERDFPPNMRVMGDFACSCIHQQWQAQFRERENDWRTIKPRFPASVRPD